MPELRLSTRESPEVATRSVLYVMLGLFTFVTISLAGLGFYFGTTFPSFSSVPPRSFPEPRIEGSTPEDLQRLQAAQRKRLSGYGWVDQKEQLVRIPIERAMELVVSRGKEAYAPLESSTPQTSNGTPAR
jgi:hypothetical protein